jgi:organic hydroperoxide reductase OsmC/OhrA
MPRTHSYATHTVWTGDRGEGTAGYRGYARTHDTSAPGRPAIPSSSDPAFRGDADRWNPELLLVAALSQCHMLSYLHRCAIGGVVVTGYEDTAEGVMSETEDGGGHFDEVVLRPLVTVAEAGMAERAQELHHEAAQLCFIAASVNFPVRHEPRALVRGEAGS